MRPIDVDAFRTKHRLSDKCEYCERNSQWDPWKCDRQEFSARDICEWLNDAPIVNGWISVKDRLPEVDKDVLVFAKPLRTWTLELPRFSSTFELHSLDLIGIVILPALVLIYIITIGQDARYYARIDPKHKDE